MKEYIRLLRPKHSIKNLLVLFPLVFSGRLLETELLFRALCAVLAFCIVASLVYILNDIRDVERDRQHPTKCRRPIASGAVPVSHAAAEGAVLCLVLVFLFWVGRFPWKSGLCLGLYFIINLGYSFGLKNVPILDIAILVSGFLLRVLFGSEVTGIATSGWLYLTVTSVSFYMGLSKRRGELRTAGGGGRKVLAYYSDSFLTQNMQYSMTVEGNSDGDPVEVIFQDKVLLLLGAVFGVLTLALLYLV